MNNKSANIFLGLVTMAAISLIAIGIGITLRQQNQSPEVFSAVTDVCNKLGINYAVPINSDFSNDNTRARSLEMGWALGIVDTTSQQANTVAFANDAISKGLNPVVRACAQSGSNPCPDLQDPAAYADFINNVASQVTGNVYFIAGPNEPLTETWLGGTEGDPNTVGPIVATYMNDVITGVTANNAILVSPVFNATNANYDALVTQMVNAGANFAGIDVIGINSYNLNYNNSSERITYYTNQTKAKAAFNGKDILITEIGALDRYQPNKSVRIDTIAQEVELLKSDNRVLGYLLFNSFGLNPDSEFAYNVFSDTEILEIAGEGCFSNVTPQPIPTPAPDTDTDTDTGSDTGTDTDPASGSGNGSESSEELREQFQVDLDSDRFFGTDNTQAGAGSLECMRGSCSSNADCSGGVAASNVVCDPILNQCVNAFCPDDTQAGGNCSCENQVQQCGDPCGNGSYPLCGDGISTCGFINRSALSCEESGTSTAPDATSPNWDQYCLPASPQNGYSTQACTSGAITSVLFAPDGIVATTQDDVIAACEQAEAPPTPPAPAAPAPVPTAGPAPQPPELPQTNLPGGVYWGLFSGLLIIAGGIWLKGKYQN